MEVGCTVSAAAQETSLSLTPVLCCILLLQLLMMSRPSTAGGLPPLLVQLEDRLGQLGWCQQPHTCVWKQQLVSALVHTELDPSTSADSEVIII